MRVAVISAQFGNFDTPKPFPKQSVPCDYFYINENNCPYTFHTIDNRLKAKYYKMLAHRDYSHDVLIWIDGNVQIKEFWFVETMLKALNGNHIAISKHHERSSVYEETAFIIDQMNEGSEYLMGRYSANSLQREVDTMPEDLKGLYWCGLFARRNNPVVNAAFEEWFMRNILWSNFDQCNFVDVTKHLNIGVVDFGEFEENDTYIRTAHNYIG